MEACKEEIKNEQNHSRENLGESSQPSLHHLTFQKSLSTF